MHKINIMICSKDRPTEIGILLQSLRTQTFKNFSILIVDDRSGIPYTSHHFFMSIVNRMKLEGNKITIHRNDIRHGVTKLRKLTMEKIMKLNGDLVLRLDDDNILEPDYIEELIKVIDSGYDIASGVVPVCGSSSIKRSTKFVKPLISDVKLNDKNEIIYFGDDCGMEYLEREIIPSPNFRSMALIKKEVHQVVEYEDNLGFCSFREEQFFSFRAILKGFKIAVNTGAIAYHLNTPSGGERTQEYYSNLDNNSKLLNEFCKKQDGDFLQKYRDQFK